MEGMLADLAVGIEQRNEFEAKIKEARPEWISVFEYFTTGFWPTYKSPEVALTPDMSKCMDLFRDWHDNKHQKRKLTWVFSLGNASVRATFGKEILRSAGRYLASCRFECVQ
jgi:hypothetical protein